MRFPSRHSSALEDPSQPLNEEYHTEPAGHKCPHVSQCNGVTFMVKRNTLRFLV